MRHTRIHADDKIHRFTQCGGIAEIAHVIGKVQYLRIALKRLLIHAPYIFLKADILKAGGQMLN